MMRACVVILLVVPLLALASCEEKPTKPDEEIVSDYDIILGANDVPFFVYNTKAREVIDTVDGLFITEYRGMEMNGDGSHLLLSSIEWDWGGTMVYDLNAEDTLKKLPMSGLIRTSNTAKYIVIYSRYCTYFLDGQTYEIVDSLIDDYGIGSFSADDSKYYCFSSGGVINIYDMASQSEDTSFAYVDNYGDTPSVYQVQFDHSGRMCYLVGSYTSYHHYLIAYSLDLDSTVLTYRISHPHDGHFQLTPDGKQIIYTDPGWIMIEEPGSGDVIFIDASTAEVIATLNAPVEARMMPGIFAITPDSRYTIVASAGQGWWTFGMIDNNRHEFIDVHDTIPPYSLWNFTAACQKLPH